MTLDVRLTRRYTASAEAVFHAWFDAEARRHWYAHGPTDVVEVEATELAVGAAWSVRFGQPGTMYREHGTILELDPPHRAVYSQTFTFPDGRSFDTVVTIEFSERDGVTELRLVDAGFPDEATRAAHESGWPGFLARIDGVLVPR